MLVIRGLVASWEFIEHDCLLELAARATCFVAVEYIHSAAMWLVASRNHLPAYYLDHSLSGEYDKYRELHIGGDYLLVYYVDEASRTIVFSDLGTHAELFE